MILRKHAPGAIVGVVSLLALSVALAAPIGGASASMAPTFAANANVRGRVVGWEKLVPQVYGAASDAHRSMWREPVFGATAAPESRALGANVSRDVCVALFAAGASDAAPHDPLSVSITGGRATPSTVVVTPGSPLSFKNVDPFPHVLYEVRDDKWLPSPLGPGATRDWTATTPGLHEIRDELFPSVAMYVWVDAAAVETVQPQRDGTFAANVPPGDYSVRGFFEGKALGKPVSVHVGATDAANHVMMKDAIDLGGMESK